jgi:hypothetical protein
MKRQLLWCFMAAWLCTGCALKSASEAEVLASTIAREPSNISCGVGDVRYCEVEVGGQKQCGCVDHRSLSHRR